MDKKSTTPPARVLNSASEAPGAHNPPGAEPGVLLLCFQCGEKPCACSALLAAMEAEHAAMERHKKSPSVVCAEERSLAWTRAYRAVNRLSQGVLF